MTAATRHQGDAAAKPRCLIVVMGVSGSGKTSVAKALAERLSLPFLEGDQLHPPANVEKMSRGIPLTDADRWPWLDRIGDGLHAAAAAGEGIVVSCSALKRTYRDRLRAAAGGDLNFVFLDGSRDVLLARLQARRNHFMPANLLDSQLSTLEDPTGERGVVTVGVDAPLEAIVEDGLQKLSVNWRA
ncbi:gluconokinase [Mycoplana sp. BE70]|uniref:gluconokinase n=1 Tax=Mycoplana sp. BE70 TaxID=2817775 RepID=UPI00286CCA4A|nr:gluconokinase [Mycoplana sp. BE70]